MARTPMKHVGVFMRRARGRRMRSGGMLTIAGPVIVDLNTQRDLLTADGVGAVFQAEKLHEPLRKLFIFAQRNDVPVISTRFNHLMTPGRSSEMAGTRGAGEGA